MIVFGVDDTGKLRAFTLVETSMPTGDTDREILVWDAGTSTWVLEPKLLSESTRLFVQKNSLQVYSNEPSQYFEVSKQGSESDLNALYTMSMGSILQFTYDQATPANNLAFFKMLQGSGVALVQVDAAGNLARSTQSLHGIGKILMSADYDHVISAPNVNVWQGDDTAWDINVVAGKFYEVELHLWLSYTGAGSVTRSFGFGSSTQNPDVDTALTVYGTVEIPDTTSPYPVQMPYGMSTPYRVKTGFDVNVTAGTGKYVRVKYYIKSTSDKIVRLYHKTSVSHTIRVKTHSRMVYHEI